MPSCNSCFLMLNVVLETSDDFLLLHDRAQRVEYYYGHAQVEAVNLCRPLLSIFFHKKKKKKRKKKRRKKKKTSSADQLVVHVQNGPTSPSTYSLVAEITQGIWNTKYRGFFFLGIWRVPMSLVQLHVSIDCNYIKNCTLVYVGIASGSCEKKNLNIFLIIKKTFRFIGVCTKPRN